MSALLEDLPVSDPVRMVEMVFPDSTNHYGTMFGGKVLEQMDRAAFICASRYAHEAMVTASLERVDFHVPIRAGQLVELIAKVVHTGRTSLTVKVTLYAEDPVRGHRVHASTGYFHMVAVNAQGRPVPVPTLTPETDAEHAEWAISEAFRRARKG